MGRGRAAVAATLRCSSGVPLRGDASKVEPACLGRVVGFGVVGALHLGITSWLRIEVTRVEILIVGLTHAASTRSVVM